MSNLYYSTYLQLEKILNSQQPVSFEDGTYAHDEMLFIIVHQAYELWFKQIIHEVDSIIALFEQDKIDDNSGDMGVLVRRLHRIGAIWKLLIDQIDVLETMTSVDFLEFRNFLIPASGFQSVQFKLIEAKLGLGMGRRHAGEYYKRVSSGGGFSPEDYETITNTESQTTIKQRLILWLERMPFSVPKFWESYRINYLASLNKLENMPERRKEFDSIFFGEGIGEFSSEAIRSALFIMLYRDYPIFQLPSQLLSALLDIDEYISIWRYRHLMMLTRMIGLRVGTGGINKEGKNQESYLEGAIKHHRAFWEISDLSTYFIERRNLPEIPESLREKFGFKQK